MQFLNQIKVQRVFVNVEAFDDVLVINIAEKDYLHGQFAIGGVIDPTMVGNLVLDDELDCDFETVDSVLGGHNEAVASGTQLVLQLIGANELGLKLVAEREIGRVGVGG